MAIVESARPITGGVDTHLDEHVAAVVDGNGGVLQVRSFPADRRGYQSLHSWLMTFGELTRVGVEGTGAYGAGLSRYLQSTGVEVIEVDRPNRQQRRRHGKSDTLDAIEAARAALSGRANGNAKTADGQVEAMRVVLVARRSARNVRIKTLNQLRHLGFTAPDELRERLRTIPAGDLGAYTAALRPGSDSNDVVVYATKLALRTLGRRVALLDDELRSLDIVLGRLVAAVAPDLLDVHGVGVHTAAILLVAAGDNPERLRTEAAWAHLCGVAPLPADAGKTQHRYRLNLGGNRQANHALWRIVFTRMSSDPRTRDYIERRSKEGLTKKEIMRVLKRDVARELYPYLTR